MFLGPLHMPPTSFREKRWHCISVQRVFVSDNGRQFDNAPFRDFCKQFGFKNHYSSPSHPQANGQAKVANWSLLKIIKTRFEGAKGVWPDELPGVLWAYRMIVRTPTVYARGVHTWLSSTIYAFVIDYAIVSMPGPISSFSD